MKLYQDDRAPNPRRVRIFAAEKGIELPTEHVDVMKKEHMSDRFTALNPFHRIPILELDDGTVLCESVSICRYFEAIEPQPPLMGTTPLEQAMIDMWQRRVELYLFAPASQSFRHGHPAMAALEDPQIKEWGAACRERAAKWLDYFDAELAGRACVAGETFTIADITLLCVVDFLPAAQLKLTDDMANLTRWHKEVSARPSASA